MLNNDHCGCRDLGNLEDITTDYPSFTKAFRSIKAANWLKLMRCPDCHQLWCVSEWDKYQVLYALKIENEETWESENESLIKEKMMLNRGGIDGVKCLWQKCALNALKGSAYCVDHLYNTGVRS
jgi:hypothetical protein